MLELSKAHRFTASNRQHHSSWHLQGQLPSWIHIFLSHTQESESPQPTCTYDVSKKTVKWMSNASWTRRSPLKTFFLLKTVSRSTKLFPDSSPQRQAFPWRLLASTNATRLWKCDVLQIYLAFSLYVVQEKAASFPGTAGSGGLI